MITDDTKSLKESYLEIFKAIDFEKIIDHPNILIAASFWENDRYSAARTCYKFMRAIDDLIDNFKASGKKITEKERTEFTAEIDNWLKMIFAGSGSHPMQTELTETLVKFKIPSWPLEAFARSMIYDINNDGFATIDTFLDYASGASVAPAAIFVHLAGLSHVNGQYSAPLFNVKESATACAVFSYLVHIIRDFQKDQLNNLNYFADEPIQRNGLTREMLYSIAKGAPVNDGFRKLIGEYYELADKYRLKTYDCVRNIWPFLEPRYQLSLEIIFDLYLMVFEKINLKDGNFTTFELNPTPGETKQRVYKTILNSRTLTF
jgi:phytoene/squalene synthetase